MVSAATGLPSDNVSAAGVRARYTSPTNIGAYLWSTLAARDLGIITPAEAAKIRGVSRETLRLMSERGLGPKRIQLSRRRFGYRASDFLELE